MAVNNKKAIKVNKKGCTHQSSNCVSWQGPDVKELGICTGDSVTEVLHDLLQDYLEMKEMFDMDNYEIDCLNLACDKQKFSEVFQRLINMLCLNTGSTETTYKYIQTTKVVSDVLVDATGYTSWGTLPSPNYDTLIFPDVESGTYKATVTLRVTESTAGGSFFIGIVEESLNPINNEFENIKPAEGLVQTHVLETSVTQTSVLKLKLKKDPTGQNCTVNSIKVTLEKVI